MIALVTTYFLIFYILIPGVLFRFVTSRFVPLKLFERTRTQEAAFAVAVATIPFVLALIGVWYVPVLRHDPFPVEERSAQLLHKDYRRVAGLLTSSDAAKLLSLNQPAESSGTVNPSGSNDENWWAVNRVLRRQARFLTWYFVLICFEAMGFGLLAGLYGDWQTQSHRYRVRLWLIRTFILPNISEWHLMLTDFNWPKRDRVEVSVDILQLDGTLYQGRVADYFIDLEGKLTGILLENVSRFDREAFHRAKDSSTAEQPISSRAFWREIPGSRFYIGQNSISNLNVRFLARDETLISMAEKILDAGDTKGYEVVLASEEDTGNSLHPDVYS